MQKSSKITASFTESVIRRMMRIVSHYDTIERMR